ARIYYHADACLVDELAVKTVDVLFSRNANDPPRHPIARGYLLHAGRNGRKLQVELQIRPPYMRTCPEHNAVWKLASLGPGRPCRQGLKDHFLDSLAPLHTLVDVLLHPPTAPGLDQGVTVLFGSRSCEAARAPNSPTLHEDEKNGRSGYGCGRPWEGALAPTGIAIQSSLFNAASPASITRITNAGYLSYVWAQFFTPALCRTSPNGAYVTWRDPDNWDAGCFDRTYDTPEQRSRMWKAFDTGVERDENKVDKILLSTVGTPHSGEPDKIENIGNPAHCPEDLMITIAEAHQRGIQVYALFSSECLGICEREGVSNTVQYNEICGDYFGEEVTFDGVAVNNESFNDVQSCNAGQLALGGVLFDLEWEAKEVH
ncbi:hypothetical protein THAOC_31238, partial [Thalassiosira oceanica]